jgi:serine/threonine protein kinase/tetratricopeptide (TPR) repeat protein
MIGTKLGPYSILERIGKGGMGEVYRARDERLERDVAVKVLPESTFADEASRRRFRREAVALARLNHPHIAAIYDFDSVDGHDFLVMEYVGGQPLAEKLAAGPLSEQEVVRLGSAVAEALDEAHGQGVVHRDLKPQNIGLTPRGQPKVLDFGLAALMRPAGGESSTATQALAGTIHYMSPEQMRGRAPDPRSDLWSLGVVLFEMATGVRPFQRALSTAVVEAILHEEAPPPASLNRSLSSGLERIILGCLRKQPDERTQSAREVAASLKALASDSVGPSASPRAQAPRRRPPWTLLAALALGVIAGVTAWRNHRDGASRVAEIRALAVLPLSNLSGDPQRAYFADAMTEELTSELASLRSLRVISSTSAARYRASDKSMRQIADELGVNALIEGSVLHTGDQVRITVQLIEAATDQHLWSRSYERRHADVIGLQRDVARAVAQEIRLALSPEEQRRFATLPTRNTQAYEAYLQAQYLLSQTDSSDAADRAVQSAAAAVGFDPAFAEAHVALAQACVQKIFFWQGGSEYDERASLAVERALALNPDLAAAHAIRGNLFFNRLRGFDIARAVPEYRRAIALNPNLASAHHLLGSELTHAGLHEEAIGEFRATLALDPHHAGAKFRWARALWQSGRFQEASALYARFNVANFERAFVLAQVGRRQEAWDLVKSMETADTTLSSLADWNAVRAYLHAVAGNADSAEREVRVALERGQDFDHFHHAAFVLAAVHAELGRPAQAVALLKRAADTGMPNYPLFRENSSMKKLWGGQEYERFMSELKLRWDELIARL